MMKIPKKLVFLIIISIIVRIMLLFHYKTVWWDSAVYIGIGKALFSFGKQGIWESFRPLILSLFLGLVWKLDLNPLIIGKLLELSCSIISIVFIYMIGKEIFNKNTGIIAAILLSFSPIFFFMGFQLYVSIPATTFLLGSLYMLLKNRYIISGALIGLSALTKFTYIIIIPFFIIYIVITQKNISRILNFSSSLTVTFIPFLILNYILYQNPFLPFTFASSVIKKVLICNYITVQPWYFYMLRIIIDNPLNVLLLAGIPLIITTAIKTKDKKKRYTYLLTICLAIVPLLYLQTMTCKIYRYMIIALPFITLISAYTIDRYTPKKLINHIFAYILILTLALTGGYYFSQINIERDTFFDNHPFLEQSEKVFVTSPWHTLHTDRKLELLYYPIFNAKKADQMFKEVTEETNATFFIDTCPAGIMCHPDDIECENKKELALTYLKENTKLVLNESINGCTYQIFRR
jgi:hypothetical protein